MFYPVIIYIILSLILVRFNFNSGLAKLIRKCSREMAQQVKVLAEKPENLSLIRGPHMIEGERKSPTNCPPESLQVCCGRHVSTHAYTHSYPPTHTQINVIKFLCRNLKPPAEGSWSMSGKAEVQNAQHLDVARVMRWWFTGQTQKDAVWSLSSIPDHKL